MLRLGYIELYLVDFGQDILGSLIDPQRFFRLGLWWLELLPLLNKVFKLFLLLFWFWFLRNIYRCQREAQLLGFLSGCGEFIMVSVKDILFVYNGVGELLLHRAFAEELLNPVT